ncbi:MAG: alpha/beta hydrolase [Chloroflexota bacterium]|nr:alpha/beta hydrolase [Chloroflexota bacterium]
MFKSFILFIGVIFMVSCTTENVSNNFFNFENQKVYYENYGDKKNPDILFIHGLMGSSTSFNDIIGLLEENFYITAIDLPGHGKSNLSINFNINEVSGVVEKFINHNFDNDLHIVGYSLGGTITNNLLNRGLTNIKSAVFIDPWFSNNTTIDLAAFKLLGFVEKREKNNWKNYSDSKKYIVNMNPNLNELQNDSISKNRFDYDIRIWDSDVQKGTLIQNKLSKITVPSLLIRPESSLIRNSQIEKLKNNYSNFSIDEIADSTHMVIFENPENISSLILKYIK